MLEFLDQNWKHCQFGRVVVTLEDDESNPTGYVAQMAVADTERLLQTDINIHLRVLGITVSVIVIVDFEI